MEAPEIPPFSGPHLAGAARADTPFTVAGRQALATGWADSGVGEIWLYPFRALRRLTIAEAAPAHAARVTPAGFERRLEVDGREVVERVYVPANAAAIVLEWEVLPPRATSDACLDPLDLELEWEVELEPQAAGRVGRVAGLTAPHGSRPAPAGAPVAPDGPGAARVGPGRAGPRAAPGTPIPAATAPAESGSWRAEVGARRLLLARDADADGTPGAAFSFDASRAVTYAAEAARSGPGIGAIRCLLGARLLASERLTLVVSATRGVPPGSAGAPSDHVRLITARATDRQRRLSFGLTVSATDPLVGQALRWAGMRLPDFLAAVTGGPRLEVAAGYGPGARPRRSAVAALRVGLAALGAGDPRLAGEVAEIALRDAESARIDAEVEETGARRFLRAWAHPPAPGEVDAAAAALLLHARYFLWTGDAGPIGAAWARLMEQARLLAPFLSEAASTSRAGAPAVDPRVASAALDQLVLAAESLGHEAEAKPLRAAARTHAPADVAARAFSWAGGWGEWFEGATSEGFAAWSALAAGGFHPGRAMWPGRAGPDDAASAAGVVCGIAYGMLGIEPDMPRSRLLLRPQLPESWELLALKGLRFGDTVVTLDFRRSDEVDRFEIEQVEGSTPLRLILEAAVPGVITGIRVDGRPADLAPRPWGERTLVPVQLVLDSRRVLEVEHTRPLAGHPARRG